MNELNDDRLMSSSPRYDTAEQLFRLAMQLQASRQGISLDDICEDCDVSRRTAERMRDALLRIYDDAIEELVDDNRVKRWRMKRPRPVMQTANSNQLTALETARQLCATHDMHDQAEALQELLWMLKSHLPSEQLGRMEPDLEALMLAEGIAMQPGPKVIVDDTIIERLRDAVLANKVLRIHYYSHLKGKKSWQTIHPYGFLYGSRPYLVAYSDKAKDWRYYRLQGIEKIEATDNSFVQDNTFSLKQYAERSFGVFQEEPVAVSLSFEKEVADDVLHYHFHPTQAVKKQKNGQVKVTFTAGGLNEICWHLFKWGDSVTIIEPDILKDRMREWCEDVLGQMK